MFTIKIADRSFRIDNRHPYIEKLCRDYMTDESPQFTISISDAELAFENKDGGGWNDGYLESLAVYRKICDLLAEEDIVLFHCSALEIDGKAFLFTAPSGTGKSTHTRLWREHFGSRVTMINDDKPLLKIAEKVTVYGTPYGGKDGIQANISAETCGIVVLRQSEKNTIRRLNEKEAFPMLLRQTYRPADITKTFRILDLVKKLSKLPVFEMGCNISDDAVITAYNALTGGEL